MDLPLALALMSFGGGLSSHVSGETPMRTFEVVLLGGVVVFCWLGVIGMWRMKEPMQALHLLVLTCDRRLCSAHYRCSDVTGAGTGLLQGVTDHRCPFRNEFRGHPCDSPRIPRTAARSLGTP